MVPADLIARDGFAVVPDVLVSGEVDLLLGLLPGAGIRSRAGARGMMTNPAVRGLARDPRLRDLASSILGRPAQPFRATLFDKSARTNWLVAWHQDTALPLRAQLAAPGWGPWSLKAGVQHAHAPARVLEQVVALRVHLDDSTADNGPLRVLPGTHVRGVLTDEQVGRLARTVAPEACLVSRGGVVLMRPLLVHASSKVLGLAPRRVLHLEYTVALELEQGLELAVT